MTASSSDRANDEGGTWTSETLPMCVRKVLLERELNKLGFRKAGQGPSMQQGGSVQQQQQQQHQSASAHPTASDQESGGSGEHGD